VSGGLAPRSAILLIQYLRSYHGATFDQGKGLLFDVRWPFLCCFGIVDRSGDEGFS